jgi:hypothetical protein
VAVFVPQLKYKILFDWDMNAWVGTKYLMRRGRKQKLMSHDLFTLQFLIDTYK